MTRLAAALLAVVLLGVVAAESASAHGNRHGLRHKTRAQAFKVPSLLKSPGFSCYHEEWGSTWGDEWLTYDDELGWMILWRCYCEPDPATPNDPVHKRCWWKIVRIIPDNWSNGRILREVFHKPGPKWGKPRLVIRSTHIRRHAPYPFGCHVHDDDRDAVIIQKRLRR